MNPNATTATIATARADAAAGLYMLQALANQAATPIDKITLRLAATFCHTAARHLGAAYEIARDYSGPPDHGPAKKGHTDNATDL
jgi:hypothetical protein